jgi:hypothetical protein
MRFICGGDHGREGPPEHGAEREDRDADAYPRPVGREDAHDLGRGPAWSCGGSQPAIANTPTPSNSTNKRPLCAHISCDVRFIA